MSEKINPSKPKDPRLKNFTAKRELILKLMEKFDLDQRKMLISKDLKAKLSN